MLSQAMRTAWQGTLKTNIYTPRSNKVKLYLGLPKKAVENRSAFKKKLKIKFCVFPCCFTTVWIQTEQEEEDAPPAPFIIGNTHTVNHLYWHLDHTDVGVDFSLQPS